MTVAVEERGVMKRQIKGWMIVMAWLSPLTGRADMPVIDFTAAANAMQEIQAWGQQALSISMENLPGIRGNQR